MAGSLSERLGCRVPIVLDVPVGKNRKIVSAIVGIGLCVFLVLDRRPLAGISQLVSREELPAEFAAGPALLLAQAVSACAWRAGMAARGPALSFRRTLECYAAGSIANTALPGNAGDAVRVGLFARTAGTGSHWLCGGVCLAVSAGRALVFFTLLVAGAAAGFVPWLLVVLPLAAVVAIAISSVALGRRRSIWLKEVGRGASAVTCGLLAWLVLAMLLRLGAAMLLLASLGSGRAFAGAVATVVALGASGAIPSRPEMSGWEAPRSPSRSPTSASTRDGRDGRDRLPRARDRCRRRVRDPGVCDRPVPRSRDSGGRVGR